MVGLAIGNRFLPTPCMGLEHLSRKQEGFEMAVSFLTTLRESTVESSLLRALSAMEGFFLSRFRSGEVLSFSIAQASCGMESLCITKCDDGGLWVGAAYSVFIKLLLELLGKAGVSASVHVGILRTLIQFVRLESPGMSSDLSSAKLMKALAAEKSKDASSQKDDILNSRKSFVTFVRPLSSQEECESYMKSRVLSSQPGGCAVAASDTFLSSLADEVDKELGQLAACKDSGTNNLPEKGLICGRKMKCADWIVSAARGKEDDDDDDDDDDDEEDDDEEDEKDVVGEEDDVEGEEGDEEGDDEEEDEEGEGDDNGEDDEGEEEDAEDDDEDGEGEEEEEDEEGDQDEEDEDDTEAESEEDVEPPKKKRK